MSSYANIADKVKKGKDTNELIKINSYTQL